MYARRVIGRKPALRLVTMKRAPRTDAVPIREVHGTCRQSNCATSTPVSNTGTTTSLHGKVQMLLERAGDMIWTVDLNMHPTYISPSVERELGYTVEEALATRMEDVFTPKSYTRAMKVLGEEMAREKRPETDPNRTRTVELDLVHRDGHVVPVEVNYSFLRSSDGRPTELLAVVRNIRKRKEAEHNFRQSTERMMNALEGTIQAMAMLVEMKDPYTAGHQRRVADLACAIGSRMNLPQDTITGLRLAGLVHDIGKVRIPTEILTNPNGLTEAEFSIIKVHPTTGHEILGSIDFPWPIAEAVYQHHERLDGSGYPRGISDRDIITEARILAVADVVEAIASHRPYRPARGVDAALQEVLDQRGLLYDPGAVDACLALFRQDGYTLK
ncbi:MAG: HD domain-containing phosphohydrolase [Chloroflexota bacterium]